MSDLDREVINVLDRVGVLGITTSQIASELNIETETVRNIIHKLKEENKIVRVGRGLWILTKYKDFHHISNFLTPDWYQREFEKTYRPFLPYHGRIMANENYGKRVHRWFLCTQGFSAEFVNNMIDRYGISQGDTIVDPFAGSGTVQVCAKMRNINSIGIELLPIFTFTCEVKTFWNINIKDLKSEINHLLNNIQSREIKLNENLFLKETKRQFKEPVLNELLKLKGEIFEIKDKNIRRLLLLALASILVPCSNLKRTPCLGYARKNISPIVVTDLFRKKSGQMIDDLTFIKRNNLGNALTKTKKDDSRKAKIEEETIKLAITSPPYINGLDYVINYKIEMAWLELVHSYHELSKIKSTMVACDNIPREVIAKFRAEDPSYLDDWVERIINQIEIAITRKSSYRRGDMHLIVRKYFEDLYPIFENIYEGLERNGRFVIVIGDSLIASVYIPTDLILAKMGERVGFSIESIEVVRKRKSGQRHDFPLRESIIVLKKERQI